MDLIAEFGFEKEPASFGQKVVTGQTSNMTLNGRAKEYCCEFNELLVIDECKVSTSLERHLIEYIHARIDGKEITEIDLNVNRQGNDQILPPVLPNESLGIIVKFKDANTFKIPPTLTKLDKNIVVFLHYRMFEAREIS